MTYVISDIHGCYDKYIKMLDLINFSDGDTLYVLGDVIDRGPDGIKILFDMMKRKNVIPIIGNHESMALGVMRISSNGLTDVSFKNAYITWMYNGGEPTLKAFMSLDAAQRRQIRSYIDTFMIYATVTFGGRNFHLSHTLPEYDLQRDIHDVTYLEFIWGEPDYDTVYDENTLFVTGHTPTGLIDPVYEGKIYIKNNHIAIDCGAVFDNGRLGCIRLDDLKEFYI